MNEKRRKQAAVRAAYAERDAALTQLQSWIDAENIENMDKMANALGIVRLSDYLRDAQEENRQSGLCTCSQQH